MNRKYALVTLAGGVAAFLVGQLVACNGHDVVSIVTGPTQDAGFDATADGAIDAPWDSSEGSPASDGGVEASNAGDEPASGDDNDAAEVNPEASTDVNGMADTSAADLDATRPLAPEAAADDAPELSEAAIDAPPSDGFADDAGFDSGPTETDASADSSTDDILRMLGSPDCLTCASTNGCIGPTATRCEALGSDLADSGPAVGQSRRDLCYGTLACILRSGCATSSSVLTCYCGNVAVQACIGAGPADGGCQHEEENGLQTTAPTHVLASFATTTLGAGMANKIASCLRGPSSQSTLTCPACFH